MISLGVILKTHLYYFKASPQINAHHVGNKKIQQEMIIAEHYIFI